MGDDVSLAMLETMDDDELSDHARYVYQRSRDTPALRGNHDALVAEWLLACLEADRRGLAMGITPRHPPGWQASAAAPIQGADKALGGLRANSPGSHRFAGSHRLAASRSSLAR